MLTLAGPFTPMLFQGEEWAASTPFQFFTSHPEEDLGRATAEGRIKEFAAMGWDADLVPDPQDPATYQRSKLDWSERDSGTHARVLAAYQRLVELRRTLPALTDPSFESISCTADEDSRLFIMRRGNTLMAVNFGDQPAEVKVDEPLALVFRTPGLPSLVDGRLQLPAHTGALLGPAV
jgi:maltooligosyltrehalose trehalohydrolase